MSAIVLMIAVLVAIVSIASSAVSAALKALIYDDRPALIVRAVEPVTTRLKPGAPMQYYLVYDKRPDCDPPAGKSEVSYRVWHYPANAPAWYEWLDYSRPSRAVPGVNVRLPDPSRIPLPSLNPGNYGFQFRSVYQCAKASGPQTIDGPVISFTVTE